MRPTMHLRNMITILVFGEKNPANRTSWTNGHLLGLSFGQLFSPPPILPM